MKLFVAAKGLVVKEGKILLLRESHTYLDGTNRGKWDLPGGRISPEEPLLHGLAREVKEETGLVVQQHGKVLGVFDSFTEIQKEMCHVVRVYFLCEPENDVVVLSKDHDSYVWIKPEEHGGYDLVGDLKEILAVYTDMTQV